MSEYVKLNLGTVLIPKNLWERAKKITKYDRDDIRSVIVENGLESLANSVDSVDYCKHGLAATQGICHQCDKESKR